MGDRVLAVWEGDGINILQLLIFKLVMSINKALDVLIL